jgi:hypothetical protein
MIDIDYSRIYTCSECNREYPTAVHLGSHLLDRHVRVTADPGAIEGDLMDQDMDSLIAFDHGLTHTERRGIRNYKLARGDYE